MKDIVEDYLKIDLRKWEREGLLSPGNGFTWHWICNNETVSEITVRVQTESLTLSYRNRSQSVTLATSSCNLGGCRYWFRCGCGKRVAILYAGDSRFACRRCLNLNYKTQHQERHERLAKKAHEIRDSLDWPRGFNNGTGPKPKGMHWRTFERISVKAENAVEKCNAAARSRFKEYEGFG
ncbi:MAG: hypothetical protein ACXW1W_06290 [Methylococcaceae bacterium]